MKEVGKSDSSVSRCTGGLESEMSEHYAVAQVSRCTGGLESKIIINA